jgi:RsiW-degrading membrane proteinase PrsW (M82 family)
MMFPVVAVSAVMPTILIMWYFYSRDLNPEPKRVLALTFGLGVLITVPVLVLVLSFEHFLVLPAGVPLLGAFIQAFMLAAVPEEILKFSVLGGFAAVRKEFEEPMDGIVYGVAASLGFATLENVLYAAGGGLSTAILRAFTAVPGHAFLGAIMGYYVGEAVCGPPERRRAAYIKACGWPILLHTLYDFPLLSIQEISPEGVTPTDAQGWVILGLAFAVIVVIVIEWVWAVRLVRRARADQLRRLAVEAPGVPIPRPNTVLSWLLVGFGGLAASAGGLVLLTLALGALLGSVEQGDVVALLVGTGLLGGLPFVLGMFAFGSGLKRLRLG